MPWAPQTYRDVAEFAVSPIMFPYTFGYAMAYYTVGTEEDMAPPDWRETVRNWGIWSFNAALAWSYNRIVHPGKYEFVSPAKAFTLVAKLAPWRAIGRSVPPIAAAAGMVYGTQQTADFVSHTLSNTGQGHHPLHGIVPLPIIGILN